MSPSEFIIEEAKVALEKARAITGYIRKNLALK